VTSITEKRLSQIQRGKMSNLLLAEFERELEVRKIELLEEALAAFRQGERGHDFMLSFFAAYSEIHGFHERLNQDVRKGNQEKKELLDGT
jgi:hypothetical protein